MGRPISPLRGTRGGHAGLCMVSLTNSCMKARTGDSQGERFNPQAQTQAVTPTLRLRTPRRVQEGIRTTYGAISEANPDASSSNRSPPAERRRRLGGTSPTGERPGTKRRESTSRGTPKPAARGGTEVAGTDVLTLSQIGLPVSAAPQTTAPAVATRTVWRNPW